MIKCNSENVFPSAKIYAGKNTDKVFYVYKVNSKSMYIGEETYDEVIQKWEVRIKGHTWKKHMENVKAKMVKYDGYFIEEKETDRKKEFNKINEIKEEQKKYLNRSGENVVRKLYENYYLKGKNYRAPNEINGNRIIIVMVNNEEKMILLNINWELVFFDLDKGIYIPFKKDLHKKNKEVLWPKVNLEEKRKAS